MTNKQYSCVHQSFFYIQLKNHPRILISYRDIAVEIKTCIKIYLFITC